MIEISVYLTMSDYANKICKIRERVNCSSIDVPITDIYRAFKYLYPQCVIELVIA